jgi:hypothetical protein
MISGLGMQCCSFINCKGVEMQGFEVIPEPSPNHEWEGNGQAARSLRIDKRHFTIIYQNDVRCFEAFPMKILVTGATGFTGDHLVRRLLQVGHAVRSLTRGNVSTNRLKQIGADLRQGDLRDRQTVDEAVKGVDVIYHLAALYRQAGLPDRV